MGDKQSKPDDQVDTNLAEGLSFADSKIEPDQYDKEALKMNEPSSITDGGKSNSTQKALQVPSENVNTSRSSGQQIGIRKMNINKSRENQGTPASKRKATGSTQVA